MQLTNFFFLKNTLYIVVPWPLCTNYINLKNVEILNNLFFKDQIIVKENENFGEILWNILFLK